VFSVFWLYTYLIYIAIYKTIMKWSLPYQYFSDVIFHLASVFLKNILQNRKESFFEIFYSWSSISISLPQHYSFYCEAYGTLTISYISCMIVSFIIWLMNGIYFPKFLKWGVFEAYFILFISVGPCTSRSMARNSECNWRWRCMSSTRWKRSCSNLWRLFVSKCIHNEGKYIGH
jgi:hypothetical protein